MAGVLPDFLFFMDHILMELYARDPTYGKRRDAHSSMLSSLGGVSGELRRIELVPCALCLFACGRAARSESYDFIQRFCGDAYSLNILMRNNRRTVASAERT